MAEARTDDQIVEVVRARRFELIDGRNRVRAVLETGTGEEGQIEAGLRILDRDGSERIIVAHMAWGALVSVAHAGETVAQLECMDELPSNLNPGTQFELCDRGGNRVLHWLVNMDGVVVEEGRIPRD